MTPHRDAFYPIALQDQASFHQMLAIHFQHLKQYNPSALISEQYKKSESLLHHSKALQIVQQRLPDPEEATSDGTIGAIILMIIYSVSTKDE